METPTRAATRHLELTPVVAGVVGDAHRTTVEHGMRRLSALLPASAVQYPGEAIAALTAEAQAMAARGYEVTFDLLALVDRRFRDAARANDRADVHVADVVRVRGIVGILRDHLETALRTLASESPELAVVGRAILEEVRHTSGDIPNRTEIAKRVGASQRDVDTAVGALLAPGGLLQHAGVGLVFSPPQLALVIEDDLAAEKPHIAQARRTVDEGVRSWSTLGNLLPPEAFGEVHRRRRHLVLHEQSCRFLLLSSLWLPDNRESAVASTYWLGRIDDPEDVQDIFLFATLNEDATIRARGATRLAAFPTAEVQERLTLLALDDDDTTVRARAVESLVSMRSESLRERLISEASDPRSLNRLHAIQALAAFADSATVEALQRIINDSSAERFLREAVIRVLATFSTPESVDALITIAFEDADEAEVAAAGLATTRSEARNRQILDVVGLPETGRLRWRQLAAAGLAMAAGTLGMAAWGIFLASMTLFFSPLTATAVVVGVLLWVTYRRLQEVHRARLRYEPVRLGLGTIALLVFVAAPVTLVVHGLAHAFVGRWRRGLYLFAMQLLGVFLFVTASLFANVLFGALNYFYVFAGVSLIVASYLFDAVPVMNDVVLRWVGGRERRRVAIYRKVFGNPEFVALVLRQVRTDAGHERRAALKLLRRFASDVDPSQLLGLLDGENPIYRRAATRGLAVSKDRIIRQLEALWVTAGPSLRAQIEQVLLSPPTAVSLETLDRLRPQLSFGARVRELFAKLEFRLRVWPVYLRALFVVSTPAVSLFVIFGYGALDNQAWAQFVVVDRYIGGLTTAARQFDESDSRMMATMAFLARNYPTQSVPRLVEYLNDSRVVAHPRVRATVARGLIDILPDPSSQAYHSIIIALDTALVDALLSGDSATFVRSTTDLANMAQARGGLDAPIALSLLQRLILTRGPDSAERWKPRAVRELGTISYSLALPALDYLVKLRAEGPLARVLRAQFNDVIEAAFKTARDSDNPEASARALLVSLEALEPPPLQTEVVQRFADSVARVPSVDPIRATIAAIDARPSKEDGYADLLARFAERSAYRVAVDSFAALKARHPQSIWPRKFIAQIEHDHLAESSGAFRRAYEELMALRDLPAFATLGIRDPEAAMVIDADFEEIALSADAFVDVERVGASLLERKTKLSRRLNAALFIYFARVVQRDAARAADALTRVEAVAREQLQSGFYNDWTYPGTRIYLMRSRLPTAVRDALLGLCREQFWYSEAEFGQILAKNRSMLALLSK